MTNQAIAQDQLSTSMIQLGQQAKKAARLLAKASQLQKNQALLAAAQLLRHQQAELIAANQLDLEFARQKNLSSAMMDRLVLNPQRIAAMAQGLEEIAALPDPVGQVIDSWERPNGLKIQRVRVPIGVFGIIYESRPNVTADAGALCLKSGNAAILRGGSESFHSSQLIGKILSQGIEQAGLPLHAIQMVDTRNRDAVGMLLTMTDFVDVIVPRGGKGLIERVMRESRVPVFAHLDGICHSYVHQSARLDMARKIVVNAKMRRTGICGATETLLIDRAIAPTHLVPILEDLAAKGCEIRGDAETCRFFAQSKLANEQDWHSEYLDAVISVRVVDGIDQAMEHIATYGSHHTEAIICEDPEAARRFLSEVDSAILLHNASTQFADGGEFGMGAEMGIATGRLHARGPVGVEQLCTFKYQVLGNGQCRP